MNNAVKQNQNHISSTFHKDYWYYIWDIKLIKEMNIGEAYLASTESEKKVGSSVEWLQEILYRQ